MKSKFILSVALLILPLTLSFAQGIWTRSLKEVIAKDLVRGDAAIAREKEKDHQLVLKDSIIGENEGKIITLENKVAEYEKVIVPTLKKEVSNVQEQHRIIQKKLNKKNFWSVSKDIVIAGLILEIVVQSVKQSAK